MDDLNFRLSINIVDFTSLRKSAQPSELAERSLFIDDNAIEYLSIENRKETGKIACILGMRTKKCLIERNEKTKD